MLSYLKIFVKVFPMNKHWLNYKVLDLFTK